jgi:hypothetical protein
MARISEKGFVAGAAYLTSCNHIHTHKGTAEIWLARTIWIHQQCYNVRSTADAIFLLALFIHIVYICHALYTSSAQLFWGPHRTKGKKKFERLVSILDFGHSIHSDLDSLRSANCSGESILYSKFKPQ